MNEEFINKNLIYICDDEEMILEVLKIMLEGAGYEVEIFEDGEELMGKINTSIINNEKLPKLILLDYWMSKKDGKQTILELKSDSKSVKIKIILISAIQELVKVSYEMGVDYISKPFDMESLLKKIKSLI